MNLLQHSRTGNRPNNDEAVLGIAHPDFTPEGAIRPYFVDAPKRAALNLPTKLVVPLPDQLPSPSNVADPIEAYGYENPFGDCVPHSMLA
jgi:hypothetical protein